MGGDVHGNLDRGGTLGGQRPVRDCRRRFTLTLDGAPMAGVAQAICNEPDTLRSIFAMVDVRNRTSLLRRVSMAQ